jgi:hypothetical protein
MIKEGHSVPNAPRAGWWSHIEDPPGSVRYWDGAQWTDQVRSSQAYSPPKRMPVLGPIIIAAGLIVACAFAFWIKPTASGPWLGYEGCGGKSAMAVTSSDQQAILDTVASRAHGNPALIKVADNYVNSCFDTAHYYLWYALISLVVGVGLGALATRRALT